MPTNIYERLIRALILHAGIGRAKLPNVLTLTLTQHGDHARKTLATLSEVGLAS